MPLPRRRSSFLGQSASPTSSERPSSTCVRAAPGGASSRGVFVGTAPPMGGASSLGTRVSRRALGISSIFLQGTRSSAAPLMPRAGQGAAGAGSSGGLNSCLMEYRDKVQALEQLNQQLEEQIRMSLDRKASCAGAWGPLRGQWEDVYRQDVRLLYSQMSGRELDQPDAPIETSLDQILAYIRNHWEKVTERNRAETDSYQECKDAKCVSRLSPEEEQLEALKVQCSDAGCKIQSLQAETESIRALKRGLENSLGDARHWHDMELQNLGSVVSKLEAELADVRGEMEQQRRDYDGLLSNKQRLEQEIRLYHGILDGEERRFQPAECSSSQRDLEGLSRTPADQGAPMQCGPKDPVDSCNP
ncbi:phakinin isoform X3 [Phyllopteryx taeniolatus]|uniref:phakinin isoform X3 n=1 Tax=Phyllopteryx taeniolatus TaxID=161469 RepID=UPI002AD482D1|nr:phakinin isoform X3 [Phyllopteryx taeniolatus]